MKILCAPTGTIDPRYPGQGIGDIKNAGFDGTVMDARLYCGPFEFKDMDRNRKNAAEWKRIFLPDHPEKIGETVKPFRQACVEKGLGASVFYVPALWKGATDGNLTECYVRLVQESLRWLVRENVHETRQVIVPPLLAGIPHEKLWEKNLEFDLSLLDIVWE